MRIKTLNDHLTECFNDEAVVVLSSFFRTDDQQLFVAVFHENYRQYHIFYEEGKGFVGFRVGSSRAFHELLSRAYRREVKQDPKDYKDIEALKVIKHNKAKAYVSYQISRSRREEAFNIGLLNKLHLQAFG